MKHRESHRFGKENRLLDAAAYGRVFKKAKRSRDGLFTVLCRSNDIGTARLGLAISKKYCKKAVARNRIRRLVRESFRRRQTMLAGLDIVVINRADAATAENTALRRSLDRHWRRCGKAGRQEA